MAGEIIRPSALPARATPVASEIIPVDNGTTVGGATIASIVTAGRPLASQAEAEAGVEATKAMTPLTTKQAIQAQGDVRFASAAQGALADTAVQPGALATVATSGAYSDLTGLPTLGTAAAQDSTAFATAAQGALADSATQPGDLATVATTGSYNDLSDKPAFSPVSNLAEFQAAIRASGAVTLDTSLTALTLVAADVPYLLDALPRIRADVLTDIILPAIQHSVASGNIANFSNANANLRILGATPVSTTLSSVASVSGSAGAWSVALNLASGTGIAVGDVLKLWNVRPLPHLSGDNAVLLASRPAQNELFMPRPTLGTIAITSGTASAVFASGTLSTNLAVNDLITVNGQTRQIATINDGTKTITVTGGNWATTITTREYWVSLPNTGVCTTSGVPSTTVNFGNGITATQLNVGDMLLVNGELHEIATIASASSITVPAAVTIAASTPFSIITTAVLHEGAHVVTAVSGNQVTVMNRSHVNPPVNRVSGGEVKALKTVLHNTGTGDGFSPIGQSSALAYLDQIAIRGNEASTGTHGLAMNGRLAEGPTQLGISSAMTLGSATAVIGWGRPAYVGRGCLLETKNVAFSDARGAACVWVQEGGEANLRSAIFSGSAGVGLLVTAGGNAKITEARAIGNAGNGITGILSTIYGELPFILANLGHGVSMDGALGFHMNEGVLALNGLSGIVSIAGSTAVRVEGVVCAANARYGIEATNSNILADEIWVTGTHGPGTPIRSVGSSISCPSASIAGNGSFGIHATLLSRINATGTRFANNTGGNTSVDASSTVLT